MSLKGFIGFLNVYFAGYYKAGNVTGGHDWSHVRDVEGMGQQIQRYLSFDPQEFIVAAILHNSDRPFELKRIITQMGGWEILLRQLLSRSLFSPEAQDRIVFAVLHHSDKHLPDPAPPLAVALQDADKLVRFRPSNLLYAGAHGGSMGIPAFLHAAPFGFTSTREKDRSSMWLGFMGNLEWIGMLSCDEARELIDRDYLTLFIYFLRLFGREIAEYTGCEDTSEDDIQKALGVYYEWVRNIVRER